MCIFYLAFKSTFFFQQTKSCEDKSQIKEYCPDIFGNNFLCVVRNISLCPNPLEKIFVISLITTLSMNVKEIIWGNIKEVVEEIDEENRGKVEVMKLKEEIKPKGWKGKNLELKNETFIQIDYWCFLLAFFLS